MSRFDVDDELSLLVETTRQFATDQPALVVRNGFFSYRWSQIFDMGSIPSSHTVLSARPVDDGTRRGRRGRSGPPTREALSERVDVGGRTGTDHDLRSGDPG